MNGDIHRQCLSSYAMKGSYEIGDYNAFDEEEKKTKNQLCSMLCVFLVGMFYSLLAHFFAIGVGRHLYIVLALVANVLLT